MGRPRKRRPIEESTSSDSVTTATPATQPIMQSWDNNAELLGLPEGSGLDLLLEEPPADFSFDFLDLMQSGSQDQSRLSPQILPAYDTGAGTSGFPLSLASDFNLLNHINFDEEPGSSAADLSKAIGDSLQRYWQSQRYKEFIDPSNSTCYGNSALKRYPVSPPEQEAPLCSSASSSDSASTPAHPPPITCGCLSSLYLALDSVSRLPRDINSAVRVARHATKVAQDVVRCKTCFDFPLKMLEFPLPIQIFQNQMCLATLVPSACNAYATVLEMIDKHSDLKQYDRATIWFSLQDIGGFWGITGAESSCPELDKYDSHDIEPSLWRTLMRAILRLDIHGIDQAPGEYAPFNYEPFGLRNVVKMMEERSFERHNYMDELAASGKLPQGGKTLFCGNYQPTPPEQRNCLQMLEAARMALDHLTIS